MTARDCLYLFLFLVLLMAHLMKDDVSERVIEERQEQIKYQPAMAHPLNYTATVTQLGKTRLYVPQQRERNF